MNALRLLAALAVFALCRTAASAQELSPTQLPEIARQIPNEWAKVPTTPTPLAKSAQAAPLVLRGTATSTGLSGFYDYQSNGQSPTWIKVNPDNPDDIYTVYMLSTTGTSVETVGSTRRVGYAHSTDGGQTWSATTDISGAGLRLGFPYLQLADVGFGYGALIATHGDPDGAGVRTMFYTKAGADFTQLFQMQRLTAGGRFGDDGAGVIWPAFAPLGDKPLVQQVLGSLSARSGEAPAPLQIAQADFDQAAAPPWKNLNVDSLATASGGGRYIVARSAAGKLGITFFQSVNFDGDIISFIRFAESTDGGKTWPVPEIIFTDEDTDLTNENGDIDTLSPSSSLDFTYMGEDPHIVFEGTINNLFKYQSIFHWSGSTGKVTMIATTDIDSARGIINHPRAQFQPGGTMGLSYPTIAVGDDGKHIVVAYMAMAQIDTNDDPLIEELKFINSSDGFGYLRVWMVGSTDGGQSWGSNHVLQDWAGPETDSASIEYPSLNDICRYDEESGNVDIDLTFQARRTPGMFAFIVEDLNGDGTANDPANRGAIQECFQYFQRTSLPPEMFNSSLGVDDKKEQTTTAGAQIKISPNPATSSAQILFTTPQTGVASLKVYDMLGREVMTVVENERLYGASHLREVDLGSLTPGAYRIVMTQGNVTASQALNVVR